MTESLELYDDISGILSGMDLSLVELDVDRRGGSKHVLVVVYRAAGTGIDECARAHRAMRPVLEARFGEDGYTLEVSSPGIDRVIRAPSEYSVFAGRGVRLQLAGGAELAGRIESCDGSILTVSRDGATEAVPLVDIRTGKLDSSQEGR